MLSDRLSRMLTAYVDGETSAHQRKVVLRLLRRSPEARVLLRKLQDDANQLRQLPRRNVDPDFADLVLQRIAVGVPKPARYQIPTSGSPVPVSWALAAAAGVLLAVGLGSYFYLSTLQAEKIATSFELGRREGPIPSDGGRIKDQVARDVGDVNVDTPDSVATVPPAEPKPERPTPFLAAKEKDRKPVSPAAKDENRLTVPAKNVEEFEKADFKLALILKVRELQEEKSRQQLREQFRKGTAHRVELTSMQPVAAMNRLEATLKAHGIRLVIDDFAQTWLKLGVAQQPSYAVYMENTTSEEVTSILQRLDFGDPRAAPARRGPMLFDSLIVSGMTPRDHKLLAKLLSIDPTQLEAPPRRTSPDALLVPKKPNFSVDIREPIAASTEKEVVQALKGQGTRRFEGAKPVGKISERLAIAVVNPPRVGKSQEVQRFLDNRKERQANTIQTLLILRPKS